MRLTSIHRWLVDRVLKRDSSVQGVDDGDRRMISCEEVLWTVVDSIQHSH